MLTKLVRVLAAILAAGHDGTRPTSRQEHEQVLELLTQSELPAANLIPGNAGESVRVRGVRGASATAVGAQLLNLHHAALDVQAWCTKSGPRCSSFPTLTASASMLTSR